jgi:hypothetical protein
MTKRQGNHPPAFFFAKTLARLLKNPFLRG